MHETKKRKRRFSFDATPINTYQGDILTACGLMVEADINGLKGGDED